MEIRTNNVVYFIKRNLAKFLYDKEDSRSIKQVEKVLKLKSVDLSKIEGFEPLKKSVQIIIHNQRNAKAKANLINAACVKFIISKNLKQYWVKSKVVATLLLLIFAFGACNPEITIDAPSECLPELVHIYGVVERSPEPDTTGHCYDADDYEPIRIGSMSPMVGNVIGVNWNNEEFVYFSSAFYDFFEVDDSMIECSMDGNSYAHYRGAAAFNEGRVSFLYFEPAIDFFDCAVNQSEEYFAFEIYVKPKMLDDESI